MEEDNELSFFKNSREMLDVEMSANIKYAKQVMNEAAEQLNALGVSYVLKMCETSFEQEDECMYILCKCSDMTIKTAGALLEYEQQRFLKSIQQIQDEKDN